jgi:hypothetical protein
MEYAIQKAYEDGTAASTFYATALFSSMIVLVSFAGEGFAVEASFLLCANHEILDYFQTMETCCMIFFMLLIIIINKCRILILRIAHASRSSKNEVELKSIAQFLNYTSIVGRYTGFCAAWSFIDFNSSILIYFPIGILLRGRYIHQNIMKGGDAMLMQLDDLKKMNILDF